MQRSPKSGDRLVGARVLIVAGKFRGKEGVCLGHAGSDGLWPVSPEGSNEIMHLRFENEFALLIDLSVDPARN
jgi:hypothetical protein